MSGLAILSLSLSHFRSHQTASLAFDGRPVALVGANGVGKTNILEAVSLLSPGRGLRRAASEDLARRPERIGWRIGAHIAGLSAAHEIDTWSEGGARQLRIDGKAAPQTALARILRMVWLVPAMDRLWTEGAEARRRFLDRMTMSFVPDHAEAALVYERAMRDRNRLLKEGATDPFWYAALEAQMATAGAQITASRVLTVARLMQAQEGAATAFPQAALAITCPEGADPTDNLTDALAQGRRRDMAAGRTLTGPHRADLAAVFSARGVPADQCSTGEQKALLISLILASARALAADLGRPPVLLLDEVAAHLDADRRAALYDELWALGAQAIMTGTEPGLFDSLGARGQCFSITGTNGPSQIAEITP